MMEQDDGPQDAKAAAAEQVSAAEPERGEITPSTPPREVGTTDDDRIEASNWDTNLTIWTTPQSAIDNWGMQAAPATTGDDTSPTTDAPSAEGSRDDAQTEGGVDSR